MLKHSEMREPNKAGYIIYNIYIMYVYMIIQVQCLVTTNDKKTCPKLITYIINIKRFFKVLDLFSLKANNNNKKNNQIKTTATTIKNQHKKTKSNENEERKKQQHMHFLFNNLMLEVLRSLVITDYNKFFIATCSLAKIYQTPLPSMTFLNSY